MENLDHSPDRSINKEGSIRHFIKILVAHLVKTVTDPLGSGLAYFIVGLVAALLIGWVFFPMILYSEDEQPVNFSHMIHTDPDIMMGVIEGDTEAERCSYCHSFRDDGSFTGIPKLFICMDCHDDPEYSLGESIEEIEFLEEYVANLKEVPWHRYYEQPDCVYFSHIPHVKNGGIACHTCHGDHGSQEYLPYYKKNRLTGYSINIWGKDISGLKENTWDQMKMADCAECHTKLNHEKNNACFVCHK